jgi:hypothetical protein
VGAGQSARWFGGTKVSKKRSGVLFGFNVFEGIDVGFVASSVNLIAGE